MLAYRGTVRRFLVFVLMVASFAAAAKELKFEQAFSDKGEPYALHYQVKVFSKGAEHQIEVWRNGQQNLKRRTDDLIETYIARKAGQSEYRLSILDMKKRIHTQIDRTNLYRIGNFADWYDLAHGLKHPMGEYLLVEAKQAEHNDVQPIKACKWFDLTQQNSMVTSHICWDSQNRIPLIIQNQEGQVIWKVLSLDRNPITAKTFEIHDEGFIKNNANQDIDRD